MRLLESALMVASRINNPVAVVAFVSVIALSAFWLVPRAKRTKIAKILLVGVIFLGSLPLAAHVYLESRGIYHIRAIILGQDGSPVEDAEVTCSIGGEPKRVRGGWEFDIPSQTRPVDGKVVLFASKKSAFLTGSTPIVLGRDYYPTVTVQLISDNSAMIRGVVVDGHNRAVAGATVSISGFADVAMTDEAGNFALPAHAADGQIVRIRVQKGTLITSQSVPAGRTPVELMLIQR
jgi:hypothetical protein